MYPHAQAMEDSKYFAFAGEKGRKNVSLISWHIYKLNVFFFY